MGAYPEILEWLRDAGLAASDEAPAITPLTGGVSSDVFRVDLRGGPICVKAALDKLRVAADWRAPVERSANEAAYLRVVADLGGLSVLVNNAGVGGPLAFVEQDTVDNWQRQYEINLRSIMLGAKHAMPHLRAAAPASIVNISSIAGLVAAPGMGAYNATKAAVWMYTKTLALEAAKADWNVRCNSVHPVFIKTPILDPFIAMAGGDEAKAHERLTRGIPLKRIGDPDDVAYCVLYLASDESRFVTGSEFKIDGGMTAQ
jgi:NAD(P)-dependent dehydrogenase (short-subunit alcohol dehydrogenase family)